MRPSPETATPRHEADRKPANRSGAAAADEILRALRDEGIFDTPGDEAFGRVTHLAASIFQTPLALIALADEQRLWSEGEPLPADTAAQVRDLCLCSQVAATGKLFWVEDARQDASLAGHSLVRGGFALRFFAAAPIVAPGGRVLGMLTVIDHRRRSFDDAQKQNLLSLAGVAADELDLRREVNRRVNAHRQFSEERFRELFESNPQPMWVFDTETLRFLAVNAMAERTYGYSREEFLSMTLADIRPPEDVPLLRASLAARKHAAGREFWRHRRKDGSVFDVEITSGDLQMSKRPARVVVAYDVADRSRSREALESRDRYFAALVQVQRDLLNPGATLAGGLEAILARLGEISGAGRVYYLEQHDAPAVRTLRADWCVPNVTPFKEDFLWQGLISLLSATHLNQLHRGESLLLPSDDETLTGQARKLFETSGVSSVLLAPLLAGGRFHGVLGFDNCVSQRLPWSQSEADHLQAAASALALALEREAAARALAGEKKRLAVMLASVHEGVITTDLHGRIVLLNRVAEELTGFLSADALGKPVDEIFNVEEATASSPAPEAAADSVAQVLAGAHPVEHNRQTWLWSRDGTRRRIATSSAPVYDERGEVTGTVRVFRDITEQEKIAEEMLKASKLESVGILAGGIAHDFNNILTAIIGNLSLARTHCAPVPKAVAKLDSAERACFRARDLTAQLLTFARGGEPVKQLTQVGEIIRESIHFALHGSTVHCHFAIPDNLWLVDADVGQIGQVINNLGINAVQAMPRGGIIEVRAENVTFAAPGDAPVGLEPGPYVKICVEDDGTGIPPEHLAKIFDPFFTTKESGSGLGLATSYSIIKKHGGQLGVDSVRGVGSIFRIYLPGQPQEVLPTAAAGNGAAKSTTRGAKQPRASGSLRVLIMDDEPAVRELAQSMLGHLGHEAVGTADGTSAIQAYREAREQGRPFDVVILDLTVPGGMGGHDAFAHLRRLDPDVKAIVSSGYSNNAIMSDHAGHGFNGMLSKPYGVNQLAGVLNEVFHGSSGA